MTHTLFTNARLIDPEGDTDQAGALLVVDGRIERVFDANAALPDHPDMTVVDCRGKCLAPGIVDIGVKVGEPGERHKESFGSAGLAAAAAV